MGILTKRKARMSGAEQSGTGAGEWQINSDQLDKANVNAELGGLKYKETLSGLSDSDLDDMIREVDHVLAQHDAELFPTEGQQPSSDPELAEIRADTVDSLIGSTAERKIDWISNRLAELENGVASGEKVVATILSHFK